MRHWIPPLWLFAGHAPHNGHSSDVCNQWWDCLRQLLHEHLDNEPLTLIMDASAEPGESDGVTVFKEGFKTSHNTRDFRQLLSSWDLCLPSTVRAMLTMVNMLRGPASTEAQNIALITSQSPGLGMTAVHGQLFCRSLMSRQLLLITKQ